MGKTEDEMEDLVLEAILEEINLKLEDLKNELEAEGVSMTVEIHKPSRLPVWLQKILGRHG